MGMFVEHLNLVAEELTPQGGWLGEPALSKHSENLLRAQ